MKNIFTVTLFVFSCSYLLGQSTFGNCDERSDNVDFCVQAFVPNFTCNEIGSSILNIPFRSHYRYRYETYAPTGVVTYDMSTTVYLLKGNQIVWSSILTSYTSPSSGYNISMTVPAIANLQSGNDYKFAIEGKFTQRNPFTGAIQENLYTWHEGSVFRYEESAELNNTSNAQATDLTPTLTWNSVVNASQYRIIIEELQGGSSYVNIHTQYVNGTSYTIPQNVLEGSKDYRISLSTMFSWSPTNACFANSITMSFSSLPVELNGFDVNIFNEKLKQSLIKWETNTERNSDYFEIEHSIDGSNFHAVGKVLAQGTSLDPIYYDFLHKKPQIGMNYYRLRIVDKDRTFEYSNIRQVTFEQSIELTINIYPNPTSNLLNIATATKNPIDRLMAYDALDTF